MKKLFAATAALALALTLPTAAFAANMQPGDAPQDAEVTLNIAPSYLVTIPTKVELKPIAIGGYGATSTISASNVKLEEGEMIDVKLESASGFTMKAGDTEWPYTITINNDEVESGDVVASYKTGETTVYTLVFTADNPTYAGDYSDTLTFTIGAPTTTGGVTIDEGWEESPVIEF